MASLLSRFFGKTEQSVVGVDIGTSAIKIVQLHTKSGKVHLDTYGSIALGPYADVEVGKATNLSIDKTREALERILSDSNVTSQNMGLAVPFSSSLISRIRMPKVAEKQLDQMIPLEARKYIPASLEEVTLDWSILPSSGSSDQEMEVPSSALGNDGEDGSEKEGSHEEHGEEKKVPEKKGDADTAGAENKKKVPQVDILLVAIHNEIVNKYKEITEKAQLNISFYEIEIFGTLRSASRPELQKPSVIMDIGAQTTKLYVIDRGSVHSSHTVNRGSQDITSALSKALGISIEEAEMVKRDVGISRTHPHIKEATSVVLGHLFTEVGRVIENYQKKYKRSIETLVLTGGGSALMGIDTAAQEHLSIAVSIVNPFQAVTAPSFMEEQLARIGPEFSVALGVALRGLQE